MSASRQTAKPMRLKEQEEEEEEEEVSSSGGFCSCPKWFVWVFRISYGIGIRGTRTRVLVPGALG